MKCKVCGRERKWILDGLCYDCAWSSTEPQTKPIKCHYCGRFAKVVDMQVVVTYGKELACKRCAKATKGTI